MGQLKDAVQQALLCGPRAAGSDACRLHRWSGYLRARALERSGVVSLESQCGGYLSINLAESALLMRVAEGGWGGWTMVSRGAVKVTVGYIQGEDAPRLKVFGSTHLYVKYTLQCKAYMWCCRVLNHLTPSKAVGQGASDPHSSMHCF